MKRRNFFTSLFGVVAGLFSFPFVGKGESKDDSGKARRIRQLELSAQRVFDTWKGKSKDDRELVRDYHGPVPCDFDSDVTEELLCDREDGTARVTLFVFRTAGRKPREIEVVTIDVYKLIEKMKEHPDGRLWQFVITPRSKG